ncbi:MAG: type I glutamate--ammonia ligase [Candidatus Helarchaeota archaeon]
MVYKIQTTVESVKKKLVENKVKWILCAMTDIRGIFQSFSSPVEKFIEDDQYFETGIGFDGSSIRGFKSIDQSDMIFFPDPDGLYILPWSNGDSQNAILIGDIREPFGSGKASDVDPRGYVAKNAVKLAESMGYKSYFGPEIEFFVFKSIDPTKLQYDYFVSPNGGAADSWGPPRILPESPDATIGGYILRPKEAYFRNPPEDTTHDFREEFGNALMKMGYKIEMSHHEVASHGQVEINFKYGELIKTADMVQVYKFTARNVAKKYGWIATFMPKPIYLDNASGMHVHNSLFSNGSNAFYDPNDDYAEINQECRYYIGGLLEHAKALTAICCPTVNSYKRLVPGFEAPINVMYSRRNRSALVRIPVYLKGEKYKNRKRIEYRGVDPSTNAYLSFAALLTAGLDGIKKKIDPGDPVDVDVYEMTSEEKRAHGVKQLPITLKDALDELTTDEVLQKALGSHVFDAFVDYKTSEWNQFCLYVTPWEIMKYLDY